MLTQSRKSTTYFREWNGFYLCPWTINNTHSILLYNVFICWRNSDFSEWTLCINMDWKNQINLPQDNSSELLIDGEIFQESHPSQLPSFEVLQMSKEWSVECLKFTSTSFRITLSKILYVMIIECINENVDYPHAQFKRKLFCVLDLVL